MLSENIAYFKLNKSIFYYKLIEINIKHVFNNSINKCCYFLIYKD